MNGVSSCWFEVRVYELDSQRHLNSAIYHQWGEQARWSHMERLGIPPERLLGAGVGPVFLEQTIRFHRELRLGDRVEVDCWFEGLEEGRSTFMVRQRFVRADDVLAAELGSVCGLLDLSSRRLVPDPARCLEELTTVTTGGAQ